MKKKQFDISVVIPMLNASTTLHKVLDSLKKQSYPIKEIIIIDNHSKDNSVDIANDFKGKNKKLNIIIIQREKTYSVGSSYNLAINKSKSPFVVVMHSDSILPTQDELKKLMAPFENDDIVATHSIIEHPKEVWLSYNFWQKCHFVNAVEKPIPAMLGKFDCYKKETFIKIGGFDIENFIPGVGSDDANLSYRFKQIGKVVPTDSRVIHLHYLGKDYSLTNFIQYRKLMARTYGRLLRINGSDIHGAGLIFLVRPILAFGSILPKIWPIFIVWSIIFSIAYMRRMYLDVSTRTNPRILLLPFISLFLVYYETFWMFEAFFLGRRKRE